MQDDFSTETFWKDFVSYKEDFVPEDFSIGKVHVFDSIDSTNSELLRRLENAGDFFDKRKYDKMLVAAKSQSAGRGRIGRRFYSPDKAGIYFSLIHVPKTQELNPAKITAAAAVSVSRAIENVFGVATKIKWVNDIYVG